MRIVPGDDLMKPYTGIVSSGIHEAMQFAPAVSRDLLSLFIGGMQG